MGSSYPTSEYGCAPRHRLAWLAGAIVFFASSGLGCTSEKLQTGRVDIVTNDDPEECVEGDSSVVQTVEAMLPNDAVFTDAELGLPMDINFNPVRDGNGELNSIFHPKRIEPVEVGSLEMRGSVIEDHFSKESQRKFLFFSGKKKVRKESLQYASFSAVYIDECRQLDYTQNFRTAPEEAVFVPVSVCCGWSYDIIYSGQYENFNGAEAHNLIFTSGKSKKYMSESDVLAEPSLRGFDVAPGVSVPLIEMGPDVDIVAELNRLFTLKDECVPIMVRYHNVPQRCVPGLGTPDTTKHTTVELTIESMKIINPAHSRWTLSASCENQTDDVALPLEDHSVIQDEVVSAGSTITPPWSAKVYTLGGGQKIVCHFAGLAADETGGVEIPSTSIEFDVPTVSEKKPVSMQLGGAGPSYEMEFRLEVRHPNGSATSKGSD